MRQFDTDRPGTYLTVGGVSRPAYLMGRGEVCYWQTRGGHWRVGRAHRFTPTH